MNLSGHITAVFLPQCSAECGMGVRSRGVLCLTNHIGSLPLEGCGSERPAASQVCNNGPCENRIEWFTGPWSQVRGEAKYLCFLFSFQQSSGLL